MSSSRVEFLKTALIKRELETTPWEALVQLAHKKVHQDISELSLSELEKRALAAFGKYDINIKQTVKRLAEYTMVSSTTLEVVEQARLALEAEYQIIPAEDLETLYRLFMNKDDGDSQKTSIETLSKDI